MRVTQMKYVAPAATIVLAAIAALLFVLLSNDEAEQNEVVPAASPTAPAQPTEPPVTPDLQATVRAANDSAMATAEAQPTATTAIQAGVELTPGQWVEIAPPPNPRFTHQLIQLNDGRVMSVGGRGPDGPVLAADIYDFTTNSWTTTRPMSESREQAGIVKLNDGRVLVTGGEGQTRLGTASVEVFEPRTGQWSAAASMSVPRFRHLSLVLADGRVLVSGGMGDDEGFVLDQSGGQDPVGGRGVTNEIYDPVTDTWTQVSSRQHSSTYGNPGYHFVEEDLRMVQLPDGRVLAPPTQGREGQSSAEYWEPEADRWSLADDLPQETFALANPVWLKMTNGAIAVNSFNDPRIFDPTSGQWDVIDRGPVGPSEVVDSGDGRLALRRAQPLNELGLIDIGAPLPAEWRVFNPGDDSWLTVPSPPTTPELPEFVTVRPGVIMQVGGRLNPFQYAESAYIMLLPPK